MFLSEVQATALSQLFTSAVCFIPLIGIVYTRRPVEQM